MAHDELHIPGSTSQDSSLTSQASSLSLEVYEVFTRSKEGAPMTHAGNVTATSADLALIYAREVYGRRGESLTIWVAPREAFMALDDRDILHPTLDRSYRLVEGYRMRDKLRARDTVAGGQEAAGEYRRS